MDDRLRGVLLASGGMVALSTDSLFVRVADTTSWTVVFWIGLLTAIVLLGGTLIRERRVLVDSLRHDGRVVAVASVLQAATVILFVLAVQETSVANVAVIIAAAPLVAAVLSWLILRERTSRRVWAAIVVTAAGVGVVISGSLGGGTLLGDLFAVGAIVGFGLAAVVLRRYPRLSRPLVVGLGGLLMALATGGQATFTGLSLETWLALAAMGAFVGPLARVLIATAPRYLPAAEVALFAPIETVLATLWAYLAFAETPAPQTWVGGVVIVAAVLWGVWPRSVGRPDLSRAS